MQLRTQAYFTADNVIISFAAALKSDRVLVHVVSLATAKKELGWMLCLTLFIVFVCLRDRHFSHTKLLFEVTTDWREVRSKFLAKSLDIFGNASYFSYFVSLNAFYRSYITYNKHNLQPENFYVLTSISHITSPALIHVLKYFLLRSVAWNTGCFVEFL